MTKIKVLIATCFLIGALAMGAEASTTAQKTHAAPVMLAAR